METRLALLTDTPALAALHAESFGAARWDEAQISDSLALHTTQGWISTHEGKAQGFILMQLVGDEAEILTFCVAQPVRKKGIGRHLLAAVLQSLHLKEARRVFLEVAVDNAAALSLYIKYGFQITGKREAYYKRDTGPVDAVILSLDIV